jgi:hypothetical protein
LIGGIILPILGRKKNYCEELKNMRVQRGESQYELDDNFFSIGIGIDVKHTNWNWNLHGKHELELELKQKT